MLNSALNHLFDPNDKHINQFFYWKVLQVSFLGPFIKSLLSKDMAKCQTVFILSTLAVSKMEVFCIKELKKGVLQSLDS